MTTIDSQSNEKYCLFRSGSDRFCVSALAIQNVGARPALCRLPLAADVLAGLAHGQREFFPVYSFSIARGNPSDARSESQMLVLTSPIGPWGLLIDEVLGLEQLELSFHPRRGQPASWTSVCVGSTNHKDQFVTIIDPRNLHEFLHKRLNDSWLPKQPIAFEGTGIVPNDTAELAVSG
jgi:chemotaxis signal transduction protein